MNKKYSSSTITTEDFKFDDEYMARMSKELINLLFRMGITDVSAKVILDLEANENVFGIYVTTTTRRSRWSDFLL